MRQRISYSPQLDGLRAICIAFTILNHIEGVPPWLNGTVGVDVFFALSGFLITALLMQEGTSLRSFYIRRFFRIAPVFYLAFALTVISAVALARFHDPAKMHELGASWRWIVAFCGEYRPAAAGSFFGHSWTVSIEEKFYLVWPLLFLALGRARISPLLFLAAVPFLMLPLDVAELRGYGGIALGSIASLLYFRHGIATVRPAVALLLWIVAYVAATFLSMTNLLIAAASAILIPSLYERKSEWMARLLSAPLMVSLGRLTFSVYMLHVLCLNAVKMAGKVLGVDHWAVVYVAGYAVSVGVALIVFRFYEQPLIRLGRRLSLITSDGAQQLAAAAAGGKKQSDESATAMT